MLRQATAAAALALLASCAPDTQAPVKVRALVLTSSGEYVPQEVQLTQVTDVVTLESPLARFVGGASIVSDPNDPLQANARTPEDLANALLRETGRDISVSYIEQEGVLWPADFHSWNLVTTYFNLERANDYFRTVGGLAERDFGQVPSVYYFAEFILKEVKPEPFTDNALFFSPVQSFLVLPFEQLQRAPLAINASVLAHEYAHLVWNRKVYGGQAFPAPVLAWSGATPSPGFNVLKSLDEGLADFHAWGSSCHGPSGCNTRVLSTSFDEGDVAERDLASPRCMAAPLRNLMYGSGSGAFSGQEYRVGTVLANALYTAGQATGQQKVLQRAVLAAYSDSNPDNPGLAQLLGATLGDQTQFTLGLAVGAITRHISDPTLRLAVCNQAVERLGVTRAELLQVGGCPASTISTPTQCSNIN